MEGKQALALFSAEIIDVQRGGVRAPLSGQFRSVPYEEQSKRDAEERITEDVRIPFLPGYLGCCAAANM
jgi:hypothetical protein